MSLSGNEDLIADYLGEAHDYIEQLNTVLMELAECDGRWPDEQVNELFRSAHSLKGLSACFGFDTTNQVTHNLETLLTKVREGTVVPDTAVVRTMFDAIDLVTTLTAEIAAGGREGASSDMMVEELRLAGTPVADGDIRHLQPQQSQQAEGSSSRRGDSNETVRVRMERLDRMVNLTGELVIARSRFQLVVQQARPLAGLDQFCNVLRELRLGVDDVTAILADDSPSMDAVRSIFGRFGEQVGRLCEQWAGMQDAGRALRDLDDVAYDLDSVVGGIHEAVLQLRMVPLDSVFRRLQRVARDTAEALGKQVTFEVRGGETQIDKRVADELINPLVHMLRNSIDHGIEPAAARRAAGKPDNGSVTVRSFQRGSSVVIEIRDDGGGIDPVRMAKKVVELGLMSPDEAAAMTPREAQRQIFNPGFSTAAQVTEVSGRGMGMDIVASTIKGLRGSLELDSVVGEGSTFTIQLPPSMSILSSLLIEVSGTMFALPLTEVREIVELDAGRVQSVQSRPVIVVREQPMPFVQLPETYRFVDGAEVARAEHAIVFGHAGSEVALGVDRLVGKEDLVIKPLCPELTAVPGLAGMAIRGDGKVTLILDPSGFAEFAMSRQRMQQVVDGVVREEPALA